MALAIMVLALGGIERVFATDSALMQGIQAPADEHQGSIEDHHLDDLPSQHSADGQKADSMVAGRVGIVMMSRSPAADWGPRALATGPQSPYLEGLLRPPRQSA